MVRKIFRLGNSLVVSLPKDILDMLGLDEGAEVSVEIEGSSDGSSSPQQVSLSPASMRSSPARSPSSWSSIAPLWRPWPGDERPYH